VLQAAYASAATSRVVRAAPRVAAPDP